MCVATASSVTDNATSIQRIAGSLTQNCDEIGAHAKFQSKFPLNFMQVPDLVAIFVSSNLQSCTLVSGCHKSAHRHTFW